MKQGIPASTVNRKIQPSWQGEWSWIITGCADLNFSRSVSSLLIPFRHDSLPFLALTSDLVSRPVFL
jgi:hypothetical protein